MIYIIGGIWIFFTLSWFILVAEMDSKKEDNPIWSAFIANVFVFVFLGLLILAGYLIFKGLKL